MRVRVYLPSVLGKIQLEAIQRGYWSVTSGTGVYYTWEQKNDDHVCRILFPKYFHTSYIICTIPLFYGNPSFIILSLQMKKKNETQKVENLAEGPTVGK